MSRFDLPMPVLLMASLALAPALAVADDASKLVVVPDPAAAPGASELPNMPPGASREQRTHEVLSPTNPPDMKATGGAGMSGGTQDVRSEPGSTIAPAQVQRVFGTDAAFIELAKTSPEQALHLQQHLQQRGLYTGPIDGLLGPQTRAAISQLLKQQHALGQQLLDRGRITTRLATRLGVNLGPAGAVEPATENRH